MNCHLCNEKLRIPSCKIWELDKRALYSFRCKRSCPAYQMDINVILPDETINYYYIPHISSQNTYIEVKAILLENGIGETVFYYSDDPLSTYDRYTFNNTIVIPRFIPLDYNKSLKEQINLLEEKFNTLLLFS